MAIRKLIFANFRTRRARVALTIAAIALSVSLVVSVTSGYKSAELAAHKYLAQYMGSTDAQISRHNDFRAGTRESLIDDLRQDPAVRRVYGRLELESGLLDKEQKPIGGRAAQIIGIRRPDDTKVETLQFIKGGWFEGDSGHVAVLDQVAADLLQIDVGDSFEIPGINGRLKLKVVGIVHKPTILARQLQTIYVPLRTLQDFVMPSGQERRVSRILIDLDRDADVDAFARRWEQRLAATDPLLKLRLSRDNRREMQKNLKGFEILSYFGGAISMLAATFIVFSALSMGVTERSRVLAMLRAIGARRSQLGWLVIGEGLMLALIGVLIGVPLGWFWIKALSWVPKFEPFFTAGVALHLGGVLFGAVGSLIAALLASFLPAWSAMRVDPLEAMSPLAKAGAAARAPYRSAIAGLLLLGVDPLILFADWQRPLAWIGVASPEEIERSFKFFAHLLAGLPAIMAGFFLLAPMLIWIAERAIGPIVAGLFGLRFALLRQQLSSGGIWRAAGTGAALMVGLAILTVQQTQGHSMINSWKLPDKFPDLFIWSPARELTPDEYARLDDVEGIRRGQVLPIAILSPELGSSMFALAGAALMPDATMFFGIDPDKAFDMMQLDFRDGTPEEAKRMLKQGRHLIVTDEFRQLKNLGVGDKLPLMTRHGKVDYTIAGVVWSPGIDVIVSVFDMGRQFDQRTAASVFGTLEDARNDFGVEGVRLFAANLDYFVEKEPLLEKVKVELGEFGLKAGDVRQIKYAIQQGLRQLLLLVSTVAFAAMAVASLGVTNTIMASIRSRRWQFGVLRAVGVTASQLLRIVLAEAILIGFVGVMLGLGAGFEMALNAQKINFIVMGYVPELTIPWNSIFAGAGAIMLISILASIWPALAVARAQPLDLLQAGRAAT